MFFLSGGLALALAFVHLARDSVFSFENYLFGSILTLTTGDIWVIIAVTILVAGIVMCFWYPLLGATQQPRYLLPYRQTPQLVQLFYFWMLAVVVWVGIKTIGGLLIGALLVIPVLTARHFASSFAKLTVLSIITAVSSVIFGLFIALFVDLPPSSLIIGMLIFLFVTQLFMQRLKG
jgi:zinc transport system permease protein